MATVDLDVQCIVHSINIRTGPSTSFKVTGKYVMQGQTVRVIEKDNTTGWYKLADGRGWITGSSQYVKVVKNNDQQKTVTPTDTKTPVPTETEPVRETSLNTVMSQGLDKRIIEMLYNSTNAKRGKNEIDASTRIFGGPHQFISQTDFRVTDGQFQLGRKFYETVFSEAPIVYFMPGKPNYLPDMDADQRSAFVQYIAGKDSENKDILDAILNNDGDFRYFTFITDYASYMRYVNLLCRFCAIYMGLGDETAPGSTVKYKFYDWSNYKFQSSYSNPDTKEQSGFFNLKELKTDLYKGLFGDYQYVQFFADPTLSFNETTSNNTSQSKVEGFFDSAEGIVKELAFLFDAAAISNNAEALQKFAGGIEELSQHLSGKNENFFSRLLGMSSNVISGANLLFPQIWTDSIYNKSYNITINLVSPYGNKESVYLNCIVPLMHLIALALPRQASANSYASPFLIRAFAKGWFTCEMGIVDNIVIEKGGQGSWTIDGLPTEIRVSLGIRDLYANLMITPNSKPFAFFQNAGLIDFLAVTCGVDITRPQFRIQLEALLYTLTNSVIDIPFNLARDTIQAIRRRLDFFYKLQ